MMSDYTVWRSVHKMSQHSSASYGHVPPDCVMSPIICNNQYIMRHMPSDEKVTTVWSGFPTFPSRNMHKSNWYLITMKIKGMKTQCDSLLDKMKNR